MYSATNGYRYGFNGKENDNEVKGEGNQQDYGFRINDPRLGKFLSVDQLSHKFPWQTPYCAFDNNPTNKIDPDGRAAAKPFEWVHTKDGKMIWDDNVKSQADAERIYGSKATYRAPGYSYCSSSGTDVVLGKNRTFTENGASKTAVNSTFKLELKPGTFSYWYSQHMGKYDTQLEAYRAWQSDPGSHQGESKWDRIFRLTASGSMEARRDYASGGMNMFGGYGRLASAIPKGFASQEQFAQAGAELEAALQQAGIKYTNIGVRGSAVTNVSSKGGGFRETAIGNLKASDIDVFIELAQKVGLNASGKTEGFIHPMKLMKEFPALQQWSQKWSEILGRQITPGGWNPGAFKDVKVINF